MKKTAYIFFGRCQYPHIGHERVFDAMRDQWMLNHNNSSYFIYLSKTHNKDNPLSFDKKLDIASRMFPLHKSRLVKEHPGHIIGILKNLDGKFDNVVMFTGPDRCDSFSELLKKYNNKEYSFNDISVTSVGYRDSAQEGVVGISGSKMREAVKNNDYQTFLSGFPESTKDLAPTIYNELCIGGYKELQK